MALDFEKLADLLDVFADKLDQETEEKRAAEVTLKMAELSPILSKYENATGEKLAEEQITSLLTSENDQFIGMLEKMATAIPEEKRSSLTMGKANSRMKKKSARSMMDEAEKRLSAWCSDPDSVYNDSL